MEILQKTCLVLTIIGAINWGLIGLLDFNLVSFLFGDMTWLSRIIYGLVGICGLYLITLFGPAKAFLHNIPENGIEVDAFYANTGFTDPWGSLNHVQASTGDLDRVFGTPAASFRAAWVENEKYDNSIIYIQLTQGSDGNWYIYPDSPAYLSAN